MHEPPGVTWIYFHSNGGVKFKNIFRWLQLYFTRKSQHSKLYSDYIIINSPYSKNTRCIARPHTSGTYAGCVRPGSLYFVYKSSFHHIDLYFATSIWWSDDIRIVRPIQTHSFHESNSLSHCHWKLCGRTEELDDFQHAYGEWQQDRILDCRK